MFENFLRTEYSEENLLFWFACQKYKKRTIETDMAEAAKMIFEEFVQVDAPRQVQYVFGEKYSRLKGGYVGFIAPLGVVVLHRLCSTTAACGGVRYVTL